MTISKNQNDAIKESIKEDLHELKHRYDHSELDMTPQVKARIPHLLDNLKTDAFDALAFVESEGYKVFRFGTTVTIHIRTDEDGHTNHLYISGLPAQ